MDNFDDVAAHLTRLGIENITRQPGSLVVTTRAASGFDVAITDSRHEITVTFGAVWHDHFEDRKEAIEYLLFGLTPSYRLIELCRGKRVVEAALEVEGPEGWRRLSVVATAARLFPWPPLRAVTRRNTLLAADAVAAELSLA